MGDRISSAPPSVGTYRATVERSVGRRRPQLRLPPEATQGGPTGVVGLDLGEALYHAGLRAGANDTGPTIRGAYDDARLARSSGEGESRLPAWRQGVGIEIGRSVLVAVLRPVALLGTRGPGTGRVYELIEPPPSTLTDRAEGRDG